MNTNLEWIAKNGGGIPPGATCAQYDGRIGKNSFYWFHYDINGYAGRGNVVFTVDEIMQAREDLDPWNEAQKLTASEYYETTEEEERAFKEIEAKQTKDNGLAWNNERQEAAIEKQLGELGRPKYSAYFKDVRHLGYIDVYRTVSLFDCDKHGHALSHAAKKLLLTGNRTGGKDVETDVREAIDSLQRWLEMRKEDQLI